MPYKVKQCGYNLYMNKQAHDRWVATGRNKGTKVSKTHGKAKIKWAGYTIHTNKSSKEYLHSKGYFR